MADQDGDAAYTELARLRSAADPERDSRREAYRERERRRAARALDRYFDSMHNDPHGDPAVAGERFVEAVGDYVLSRLGDAAHWGVNGGAAHTSEVCRTCGCALMTDGTCEDCAEAHRERQPGYIPRDLQQKSHYDAADTVWFGPADHPGRGGLPLAQNPDYGVSE